MSSAFSNWTLTSAELHNAKVQEAKRRKRGLHPTTPGPAIPNDAVEREDKLQKDIRDFCKRMGWLCLCGSMAHKTKRTIGEPDFTILMNNGRTLFIEAKAKKGVHSSAQLRFRANASALGHIVHEVRSMRQFRALLVLP